MIYFTRNDASRNIFAYANGPTLVFIKAHTQNVAKYLNIDKNRIVINSLKIICWVCDFLDFMVYELGLRVSRLDVQQCCMSFMIP